MAEELRYEAVAFEPIESRKLFLALQALLCFGLAFIMLWITTIRPMVSFETEEISPFLFNFLRFGVTALLVLWGVFFVVKAVRCKIIFEANQMAVHQSFATTIITYASISGFVWRKDIARFAGFIPVVAVKICTIVGENQAPLVTISSLDYKDLEKRMQALEVHLAHEPIL